MKAEAHSRRRNVIANGIVEVKGEDTEAVARDFLVKDLKMEKADVDKMLFRDIHRLPASKRKDENGQPIILPRPIIMAFLQQKDRNSVVRKAFELKGTNLSLKTDLPKVLNDLRGRAHAKGAI